MHLAACPTCSGCRAQEPTKRTAFKSIGERLFGVCLWISEINSIEQACYTNTYNNPRCKCWSGEQQKASYPLLQHSWRAGVHSIGASRESEGRRGGNACVQENKIHPYATEISAIISQQANRDLLDKRVRMTLAPNRALCTQEHSPFLSFESY